MSTEAPKVKVALCINTKDFAWQSFTDDMSLVPVMPCDIDTMQPRLIDRAICETDESTLQLLPYNVLLNEEGKVFCYSRGGAGAEGRLHGKLSIGIGGHVDIAPGPGDWSLMSMLQMEAIREIMEEVSMSWAGPLPTFTNFIIDRTNPVGRVHLGLLSINHIQTAQIGKLEYGMVENGEFVDIDFLCEPEQFSRLENWSQAVADHLRREKHSGVCN